MATKKQPSSKKTATKASDKKASKKRFDVSIIYKEPHPERNKISGKFVFFYFLFIGTTLLFAALSVVLFMYASDTLNKYQSIEACTRAHVRCNVRYDNNQYTVEEAE